MTLADGTIVDLPHHSLLGHRRVASENTLRSVPGRLDPAELSAAGPARHGLAVGLNEGAGYGAVTRAEPTGRFIDSKSSSRSPTTGCRRRFVPSWKTYTS
nr:hypothetical protein OG999_36825 [Streptomyces sp. NBC_00886]